MGILSKARARAVESEGKASSTGTTWTPNQRTPAALAVARLIALKAKAQKLDAEIRAEQDAIVSYGTKCLVDHICKSGELPSSPLRVQAPGGESVAFVVQDRSTSTRVSIAQVDQVEDVVGEGHDLFQETTTYSLDQDVLALPGVAPAVEKSLSATITQLVNAGRITHEQGDKLIVAETKRTFAPGTVARTGELCGRSRAKIEAFLAALGTAFTRAIRV